MTLQNTTFWGLRTPVGDCNPKFELYWVVLTNPQTNRRLPKHPTFFSMLQHWVIKHNIHATVNQMLTVSGVFLPEICKSVANSATAWLYWMSLLQTVHYISLTRCQSFNTDSICYHHLLCRLIYFLMHDFISLLTCCDVMLCCVAAFVNLLINELWLCMYVTSELWPTMSRKGR